MPRVGSVVVDVKKDGGLVWMVVFKREGGEFEIAACGKWEGFGPKGVISDTDGDECFGGFEGRKRKVPKAQMDLITFVERLEQRLLNGEVVAVSCMDLKARFFVEDLEAVAFFGWAKHGIGAALSMGIVCFWRKRPCLGADQRGVIERGSLVVGGISAVWEGSAAKEGQDR